MTAINPVAPYTKLDNTTQTGSTYKNNIDNNSVIGMRIADAFAPHAQSSPNMTIQVDPGYIFTAPTLTETAAQNTGTITAPVSNPRIDRVVGDSSTGSISVVTGVEAGSPTAPAIPAGKFPIAQIALATSTTSITNALISDERALSGGGSTGGGFGLEASLASASTADLGTIPSHVVLLTGTTGINSWGNSASTSSPIYITRFTTVIVLNASLMPGGVQPYATASGDVMMWKFEGSSTWRLVAYSLASGKSLTPSGPTTLATGSASGASITLDLSSYTGSYSFFEIFFTFDQTLMTGGTNMNVQACAAASPLTTQHQWSFERTDSSPGAGTTGNDNDSKIEIAENVKSAVAIGLGKLTCAFNSTGTQKQMQMNFSTTCVDNSTHTRSCNGSGFFFNTASTPNGLKFSMSSGNINFANYRVVGYP